eukprot:6760563-Prorocentrum_lima.AAC.1
MPINRPTLPLQTTPWPCPLRITTTASVHDLLWHLPTVPHKGSACAQSTGYSCRFKQHHGL